MIQRVRKLSVADQILIGLGLIGAIWYGIWFWKGQHADGHARDRITPDEAIEMAHIFLTNQGYALNQLRPEVELMAHRPLLKTLQQTHGRQGLGDVLAQGTTPAYYWRVAWKSQINADELAPNFDEYQYVVLVTLRGGIWGFRNGHTDAVADFPAPEVFRATLGEALAPPRLALNERFATVDSLQRSMGMSRPLQTLALDSLRMSAVRPQAQPFEAHALFGEIIAQLTQRPLRHREMVQVAERYLQQTLFHDWMMAVDTVAIIPESQISQVVFRGTAPDVAQDAIVAVRVVNGARARGGLVGLDAQYSEHSALFALTNAFELKDFRGLLVYTILILFFAAVFFRRLSARLIDIRPALLDALFVGVLAFIGLMMTENIAELPGRSLSERYIYLTIGASIAGSGITLIMLLVSGATDSVTRARWPEKIESRAQFRMGVFRSEPVGGALGRGVLLAFALMAAMLLILQVFPSWALDGSPRFVHRLLPSASAAWLVGYGWSHLLGLLLVMGVVAYLRRWKKAWVVILGCAVLIAALDILPMSFAPEGIQLMVHLGLGILIGWAFWRFDILVIYLGVWAFSVLWEIAHAWAVDGPAMALDAAIVFTLGVGVAFVAYRGLSSGNTGEMVPTYIPPYIKALKQQERMERELELARQVQASFLPKRMPNIPEMDIAAHCIPAQEIGGDYYEFIRVGEHQVAMVIGDVSGKGIEAAFYMTLAKGFIQTLAREGFSPTEVLRRTNRLFCANVERGTFISIIYGVLDTQAQTFTFARAGHNPIILKRARAAAPEMLQPSGLAIGLVTGPAFDDRIHQEVLQLEPQDVLVFYTDGYSEAMNLAKEQFGEDRLMERIGALSQHGANHVLQTLTTDVETFAGEADQHDDMTMMVVKVQVP